MQRHPPVDSDRLRAVIEAAGHSQSSLARKIGVSQATIAKLISGGGFGSKYLHLIARELHTTPAYLTGETDDPDEGYIPVPATETIAGDLGLVPVREIDLTFGMGATYLEVPVTTEMRYFSRDWIRQYTNADPEKLMFAQGAGDSMAPTILDSDLLLIDLSQQNISMADKFWCIAYGNTGMVKRLRPMPDGGVKILSDNPLVPPETAHDGEMHVIGRVVGIVRKM